VSEPSSRLPVRYLISVVVLGTIFLVLLFTYLGLAFAFRDPTPTQQSALLILQHLLSVVGGGVVGLLAGKSSG